MCLGVPGKVIGLSTVDGLATGTVDFGGLRKEVCLAYCPEVELGDYVIVHVGFAISRLDEENALATLAVIRAMPGAMEQELGLQGGAA